MSSTALFSDLSTLITDNNSEQQRQLLRAKCRESLYFFCKAVLGFRDFNTSVHLPACEFVQNQAHPRKLLMLPRAFFKSHLATIGYTVWLIIQEPRDRFRGPEERILIANATATNAEQFLSKIKSIFERNAVFQWLFPELVPDFASRQITWNVGSASVPRKTDYPEPTFSTIGVGGAVVSRHFTRIVLDDLINDQHAASPDLMKKAIEWYTYVESLLEVSGRDEVVVVGTRWSFSDLYSHIEETEGEQSEKNPLGFVKHVRSAIERDQPIFPERFSFQELARLREKLGSYMFGALYLNRPQGEGINDFNTDWLRHYTFSEKGKIELDDGRVVDPLSFDRVTIVDIATSLRRDADFSAVIVVGVDEARRVYLLEAWHGRVQTQTLLDRILTLSSRWRTRAIFYEDSAQQKLIEYSIKQHMKETGQFFTVLPVKAGNKQTKEQRIRLISPYFQSGNVFIRESMNEFVNEYKEFPLGKHDDLIDAFSYFPRCVRFMYNDPEPEPNNRIEEDYDFQLMLQGRSRTTGY